MDKFTRLPPMSQSAKPKESEIFKMFVNAGGDLIELREKFYPLLERNLDLEEDHTPESAVFALHKAISTYESSVERPTIDLRERARDFLNVILENEEQREKAWKLWKKSYPKNKKDNK